MGLALAQVVLPYTTGLPEDVAINTFSFLTTPDPVDQDCADEITVALAAFYNTVTDGSVALGNFISSFVDRTASACKVRVYDRDPGPPQNLTLVDEQSFTLTAAGATANLPDEVALCLSFHGLQNGSATDGRRRGRVYIGPFNTAADTTPVNGQSVPADDLILALKGAGEALRDWTWAAGTVESWEVFSRVDVASHEITGGWVDNAWDTQRRRGKNPSARTNW